VTRRYHFDPHALALDALRSDEDARGSDVYVADALRGYDPGRGQAQALLHSAI
jgi:hypothetical protein